MTNYYKTNKRVTISQQHGAALLAALIILTIIAFTGVTVARLTTSTQQDSSLFSDKTQSRLNAEAPLNLVLNALKEEAIEAAEILAEEIDEKKVKDPIAIIKKDNDRWWHDEVVWTNNRKILSEFPGNPEFVIENAGTNQRLQQRDRATTITTFYRLTSRASGKLDKDAAQSEKANLVQAQSVIQTYIGIVE